MPRHSMGLPSIHWGGGGARGVNVIGIYLIIYTTSPLVVSGMGLLDVYVRPRSDRLVPRKPAVRPHRSSRGTRPVVPLRSVQCGTGPLGLIAFVTMDHKPPGPKPDEAGGRSRWFRVGGAGGSDGWSALLKGEMVGNGIRGLLFGVVNGYPLNPLNI